MEFDISVLPGCSATGCAAPGMDNPLEVDGPDAPAAAAAAMPEANEGEDFMWGRDRPNEGDESESLVTRGHLRGFLWLETKWLRNIYIYIYISPLYSH